MPKGKRETGNGIFAGIVWTFFLGWYVGVVTTKIPSQYWCVFAVVYAPTLAAVVWLFSNPVKQSEDKSTTAKK